MNLNLNLNLNLRRYAELLGRQFICGETRDADRMRILQVRHINLISLALLTLYY